MRASYKISQAILNLAKDKMATMKISRAMNRNKKIKSL